MKRQETGRLGEKLAQDFLKKQGYHIRETNYRCPYGEIDIIATDKDYLTFVEVRTKSTNNFGTPEQSITPAKKKHLRAAALHYQQNNEKLPESWRIDVVAIEFDARNKPQIKLIENAVTGD